jgi:phosphatidylglycerol:prolipoprotein diacylglycerol transferase
MSSIIHHPLSYDVGPLQITGFGLAVLLGFVIGQISAQRELERRGRIADAAAVPDVNFAAVLGFIVGAKIYYAILTGNPMDLFHRAGFVFWGGLMGGIAGAAIMLRRKRIPFTRMSDVGGIGIAAGYAVGRTGCWAVGDDYGRPWNGFLSVRFPEGAPPSTAANMQQLFHITPPAGVSPYEVLAVYPTQLFEVVLGFLMFAILWRLRDHEHAEGWLFGLYCVLAGVERFIIEFFRAKDDRFFGAFTSAQLIAVGFIIVGGIWMRARRQARAGQPGIYSTSEELARSA